MFGKTMPEGGEGMCMYKCDVVKHTGAEKKKPVKANYVNQFHEKNNFFLFKKYFPLKNQKKNSKISKKKICEIDSLF